MQATDGDVGVRGVGPEQRRLVNREVPYLNGAIERNGVQLERVTGLQVASFQARVGGRNRCDTEHAVLNGVAALV